MLRTQTRELGQFNCNVPEPTDIILGKTEKTLIEQQLGRKIFGGSAGTDDATTVTACTSRLELAECLINLALCSNNSEPFMVFLDDRVQENEMVLSAMEAELQSLVAQLNLPAQQ